MTDEQTVFVVDDDEAVRKALALLLRSVGHTVTTYASAKAFLDDFDPSRHGCLILDIRIPGMNGLELQERLNSVDSILPIIFITGHGDVPVAVRAMRGGAFDFLEKPFSDEALLERVDQALRHDARNREEVAEREVIRGRLALLTPREREVMQRIIDGQPNKVVAMELGLSERTVEIHRAKVMEKMQASSLAHLVRMALQQ